MTSHLNVKKPLACVSQTSSEIDSDATDSYIA